MFERFTTEARAVVIDAQSQARRLDHRRIGTEHLLLALLAGGGRSAEILAEYGITSRAVEDALARLATPDADRDALARLGIDLDRIRDAADSTFGGGALERARTRRHRRSSRSRWSDQTNHLPFTRRAKQVLKLSLREALALHHREIGAEHIALGLLRDGGGTAGLILAEHAVPVDEVRARLEVSAARAG